MPFRLNSEAPHGIWSHNSGGEHFMKHFGDVADVSRFASEADIVLDRNMILGRMQNGGLVVARHILSDGGAGEIAGFAMANMEYEGKKPTVFNLESVFVDPEHRSRGIAGYMVGKLLASRRYTSPSMDMSILRMPPIMTCNGAEYLLPGDHVMAAKGVRSEEEFRSDLDELINLVCGNKIPMLLEAEATPTLYRDGLGVPVQTNPNEHTYLTATNMLNRNRIE